MTPVRLREVPCRSKEIELGDTTEKQACSDVIGATVPQAALGRTRRGPDDQLIMLDADCCPRRLRGALLAESAFPVCDAVDVQWQSGWLFVCRAAH